jgi:hypothetical protein
MVEMFNPFIHRRHVRQPKSPMECEIYYVWANEQNHYVQVKNFENFAKATNIVSPRILESIPRLVLEYMY